MGLILDCSGCLALVIVAALFRPQKCNLRNIMANTFPLHVLYAVPTTPRKGLSMSTYNLLSTVHQHQGILWLIDCHAGDLLLKSPLYLFWTFKAPLPLLSCSSPLYVSLNLNLLLFFFISDAREDIQKKKCWQVDQFTVDKGMCIWN